MTVFPPSASPMASANTRSLPLWIAGAGAVTALCLALATASQTYLSMRSHGHSFSRIVVWQLGCWSFWAVAAPWVMRISVTRTLPTLAGVGVILTVLQSALASALALWVQPHVPAVSRSFVQLIQNLWWFPLLVDPLVFALLVVGGRGLHALERTRRLAVRESQLEAQLVRAHLDALRLEIQPHFLFNTLNSVAGLIRQQRNDAALSTLLELSELMRASLKEPKGQLASLHDELALMRRYVDLHRLRFGDRLSVTYDVDARCEHHLVPTLVLQPLIENAFKHGLATRDTDCRLGISVCASTDGAVHLAVSDNGAGFPPAFDWQLDEGTGLRNIRQRLDALYGDAARLTMTRHPEAGSTVELLIPERPAHPLPPATPLT